LRLVFPRLRRPFFGILPESLAGPARRDSHELRFDHASRGAEIGSVGPDRLVLTADGWDLSMWPTAMGASVE
jgi:hypothetical protein